MQKDPVPYCYEDGSDWCNGGTLELLFANFAIRGPLLPGSEQYADLRMIPGGEEALTKQPGWASFKRLWPRADAIFAGDDDGTFNLSDVDLVVDGEPDCSTTGHSGCKLSQIYPGLGLADRWGRSTSPSGKTFIQVKAEPGREDEQLAYVESEFNRLRPWWVPGVNAPKRVLIPVKYSYLELWRWATLLDRFAGSRSNDIGIWGAGVSYNTSSAPRESHYLPAAGLTLIEDLHKPSSIARIRSTIAIGSFDPQKTIAALPQLFSQLGIPADAVGIVVDMNALPTGPEGPE